MTPLRDVGPRRRRRRDPDGKAVLFSGTSARPRPGVVVVECGECGTSTEMSYADFVVANLPIAVWLPPIGVHFNRRMTCPACSRWTWVRARWW